MVSVITPCYNSEEYLSQTIESVISQTYLDWEMLIVDDCSNDSSPEIANKYAATEGRIRVIRLANNSGPAVARNKGIELAKGRYIAFLDSDDLWTDKKLEEQIRFMEKNGYFFTYSYYKLINENGYEVKDIVKPPKRLSYRELLKSNRIGCLTAIYDSSKIGKVYMPSIKKRQDYGLWLSILKRYGNGYCLEEPLAFYRIRSGSVSSKKLELLKYNWKLFYKIENLTFTQSLYYLFQNILNKLFCEKYGKNKR